MDKEQILAKLVTAAPAPMGGNRPHRRPQGPTGIPKPLPSVDVMVRNIVAWLNAWDEAKGSDERANFITNIRGHFRNIPGLQEAVYEALVSAPLGKKWPEFTRVM